MAVTAAALVPHPPLLVPELGRGASPELDQLRSACRRAVATTLDRVDALVVVGPAPSWGEVEPSATGSFAPYGATVTARFPAPAPAGRTSANAGDAREAGSPAGTLADAGAARRPGSSRRARAAVGGQWLDRRGLPPGRLVELPLSLAVAAWLLGLEAEERPLPQVAAFGVPASMRAGQAAAAGRALAGAMRPGLRVGLLVMGDLSARRTPKAPATFHPGAEELDRQIADAIRKAELGPVLDVDPGLAEELRVGGMAPLWLLAGALENAGDLRSEVLYEAAPFGVGYLVGVIEPR